MACLVAEDFHRRVQGPQAPFPESRALQPSATAPDAYQQTSGTDGKLLEIVQARAIVSFHDTTFRSSLSFLMDEIICVFVDSMTSSTGYTPASHPTSFYAPKTYRVREGPGGWLQRSSNYAWM
ncbi:hypothetical protein AAHC03_016671 [Spirometra sp. Aus1]